MIKQELENLVSKALKSLNLEGVKFVVEHPADSKMGDYSTNIGIKLREHKDQIFEYIQKHKPDEVERVELVGPGFINFYLSKKFFSKSLKAILKNKNFGFDQSLSGQKILLEHTQPNPFKEFHIGHLMNNVIGESLSSLLKSGGGEVRVASYHGDVGLHVAKAIWGRMQDASLSWGEAYALGDKSYEANREEIAVINKKIYEKSDEKLNKLYEVGRKMSLESFEKMYARLGSNFDYHFFESESGPIGKVLVEKNLGKVFERSEGAIVFKGENFEPKTHTRVFLNKDGLPTYEAKELGLAELKLKKWKYDKSVTVTANEQDSFFNVVEVAIGEVFPKLKAKLKHVSHGVLKLPTGKMSSRTGSIITAENLLEEVKEKTKGKEDVAIGAIKYMILRQAVGGDIVFDIEKSVSTEGDSGVYLQYAHARANSILEKAGFWKHFKAKHFAKTQSGTREIERILYVFPEVVSRSREDLAPHHLITYLTELAGSFNNFYAHEPVLDNSPESSYRLLIVQAFKVVMKNGLTALGIKAPERV